MPKFLKLVFVVLAGAAIGLVTALNADPVFAKRSAFCGMIDYGRAAVSLVAATRSEQPKSAILRTDGDLALHRTSHGLFWTPLRDSNIGSVAEEVWSGVYSPGRDLSGKVILDCGANVGAFTRYALEGGAKLVVAIEIAPENLSALRRTFAAEIDAHRVIVYPKGVWDRTESLVLNTYGSDSMGDTVALNPPQALSGPTVQLTTIDSLVRELRLSKVDLIKMDIEGSERRALRGAVETINRFHPFLSVSIEHAADDAEVIPAIIRDIWPQAHISCGSCQFVKTEYVRRLQPWVIFASAD